MRRAAIVDVSGLSPAAPDPSPLRVTAEKYVRVHWRQLAATAWRYFLTAGRGACVLRYPPRRKGHDDVEYMLAARRGLLRLDRDDDAAVETALATYDPAQSLIACFLVRADDGEHGIFIKATHEPPPPAASRAQGN